MMRVRKQSRVMRGGTLALVAAGMLLLMLAVTLEAQTANQTVSTTVSANGLVTSRVLNQHGNLAQTSLASYLERVRAETSDTKPLAGAIWTENGRLARLSTMFGRCDLMT